MLKLGEDEQEEKRVGRGRRREWGGGGEENGEGEEKRVGEGEENRVDAEMVCDGEVSGSFYLFLLL